MKVIAVFVTLLAVSLAAPSELAVTDERIIVPEKSVDSEKLVEKEGAVKPSSESANEDKVVEKAENTPSAEVANLEKNPPVVVIATSVEDKKTDEEKIAEEEKQEKKHEYAAICRASTGATQEQITAIGQDPIVDAPTAVKCYVKCLAEHYQIEQDEQPKNILLRLNKTSDLTADEIETITETCTEVHTDDPCDSAYLRYSCFFRASGEKLRIA